MHDWWVWLLLLMFFCCDFTSRWRCRRRCKSNVYKLSYCRIDLLDRHLWFYRFSATINAAMECRTNEKLTEQWHWNYWEWNVGAEKFGFVISFAHSWFFILSLFLSFSACFDAYTFTSAFTASQIWMLSHIIN